MHISYPLGAGRFSITLHKLATLAAISALVFMASLISAGSGFSTAQAQSMQGMTCYDLWFERNSIFANKGFCFRSQRAQSAFGAACFPPYGQLSRNEQWRVDALQRQERNMRCQPGGQSGNTQPAQPQGANYAAMTCNQLWTARNGILARNGHCFRSNRGIAAFGTGCFAPYGRLGNADQRQVDAIIGWERRGGCR